MRRESVGRPGPRGQTACYRPAALSHAFLDGLRPTLHISHRGGAALAPENTMVAFRSAADVHRTDIIELDVHVSADGEVVVAHDAGLERCTDGTGTIAERTWRELSSLDAGWSFSPDGGATHPFRGTGVRLPRLAEVLDALPAMRFNVEHKAEGGEDRLAAVVRAAGAEDRVCVGSESDEIAHRVLHAMPDACHFFPGRALAGAVLFLRGQLPAPPDGPWCVLDMPLSFGDDRLVDRELLAAAAARGWWVNVWTIDDPAEMARLAGDGVGGIMTDRPDLLREVLSGRGRGGP